MPAALSVHLILIVAQVCFAALPVAGRLALNGTIGPAAIVLARVCGGALVFTLIAWRRGVLRIRREDMWPLLGCALLGVAANQELFVHGLARSTATNASLLNATIPVWTIVVAIVLRREPLRLRRMLGVVVAFGGVIALVGVDRMSTAPGHLLGSIMVLLNSLCYSSFLVVVRPLGERYDPFALIAWLFIAAAPFVAPFGIHELVNSPPLAGADFAYLGFLVAVPTVTAYALVQIALQRSESTLVAAYIYLQPVFATLGAMALLGEQPSLRTLLCGAVVLAGVRIAVVRAARQ